MKEAYFAQLDTIPEGSLLIDVTRKPPRFLRQDQRARLERRPELAPSEELLGEFLKTKKELKRQGLADVPAHNRAMESVGYRERFFDQIENDQAAMRTLSGLATADDEQDVYFVCHCGPGKGCHRFLLIELAESIRRESGS